MQRKYVSKHFFKFMFICILFIIFLSINFNILAQYPERSINLIVPFDPGGGSDVTCRTFEPYARELFNQELTFLYKPGASGSIGTYEVSKSTPDGYTIGTFNTPHIILQPLIGVGQYSPWDLTFIGQIAADCVLMSTSKNSPYKSLADFIADAQKNPGKLTLGSSDTLASSHITALMLVKETGIDVEIVTFQSGTECAAALLGGHVNVGLTGGASMLGSIDEATPLANTFENRSETLPEVPTFKELGYDIVIEVGRIFIAPSGLDEEVENTLKNTFKSVYNNPDFQNDLKKSGLNPLWRSGDDLEKYLHEFEQKAKMLIEEFNLVQ